MSCLRAILQSDPRRWEDHPLLRDCLPLFVDCERHLRDIENTAPQKIVLIATSLPTFAAALLAIWRAGHIVVLPPNTQPQTLLQLQPHCAAMISDDNTALPAELTLPQWRLSPSTSVVVTNTPDVNVHNVCLELYTSGSSGEPKAVTRTVQQLEAEVDQLQQQFDASLSHTNVVATVPLQHIYGLIFRVLWPLCSQRRSDADSHVYPENLFARIQPCPARSIILVSSPAHLERLAAHYDVRSIAPQLSAVFSSGAPLSRASALQLHEQWQQAPIEVLGSTETGGVAWRQRTPDDTQDAWQSFASVTLQLDERGVLRVQSPAAMSPDWCVLGDKAELLAPNRFCLLGRADRIVKLEGKRVALNQMENCLLQMPGIACAAVCQLDGERTHLGVVVVLHGLLLDELARHGKRSLNEKIKQHLLNYFERVTLPRYFRYVDQLPIDERGKTTQAALQALFMVES